MPPLRACPQDIYCPPVPPGSPGRVHISLSPIHHIVSCFASSEMIPQIPRDVPAPPVWIKYR